jgi:PAS domain S-box-containing protein
MEQSRKQQIYFIVSVPFIFTVTILAALFFEGYLLFHSLGELFTVLVGITMVIVSYYTYHFTKNNFLFYLGMGYFWIALLDLLHLLTYKGLKIYSIESADTTLTFWVLARFFEVLLILSAPFVDFTLISKRKFFILFGFFFAFTYWLAFSEYRPNWFVENSGLTPLKIYAEYMIIVLFSVALLVYGREQKKFDIIVYRYIILSILFTIGAGFSFTLYADMYAFQVVLGHIFKFLSYWMIFLAIVQTSLQKPFMLLAQESSTYNVIPLPAVVVDANGIIRQINEATETFLHLPKDEILHHSNHTLFHDKKLRPSECHICKAMQKGEKLLAYELDRGSQTCSFTVSPIYSVDKTTAGSIQVCTDISEHKRSEKELRKFQTVIEQSPISIIITDIEGNIEYVNPYFENVTGYTSKEVVGKNPRLLASGLTTKDEYSRLWNQVINEGGWSGVFKNIKKSGEEYWESAIISPIKDSHGVITNYIGMKQNISEKVALEQLLKDQEELMIVQSRHAAMGEMIGMIAHQWRQPLATISMGANNLLLDADMGHLEQTVIKNEANDIIKQVNHLSQTIEDFRNYFRPDREKEFVNIKDVVDETLSMIGKSLENNNIDIALSLSSTSEIEIYKRELIQVLTNILHNAKEAMNENCKDEKKLFINVKEKTDCVVIEVCDNGGGIDEEIIDKIFEPYFSTKSKQTGTGLGLYMCKTIVNKHLNGSIKAKNNKIGGVCLIVSLYK